MKENGSPTVGMDRVGLSAGLRVWTVPFSRQLPVLKLSAQILWSLAYGVADVRDEEAATENRLLHSPITREGPQDNHGTSMAFLHKRLFLLTSHWVG